MRHYLTKRTVIGIAKEDNPYYESAIYLYANADTMYKNQIISKDFYLKHIDYVRKTIGTDKVISINSTKEENKFNVYELDLVSDGKTIYTPKFDEELKNWYIETGDDENASN